MRILEEYARKLPSVEGEPVAKATGDKPGSPSIETWLSRNQQTRRLVYGSNKRIDKIVVIWWRSAKPGVLEQETPVNARMFTVDYAGGIVLQMTLELEPITRPSGGSIKTNAQYTPGRIVQGTGIKLDTTFPRLPTWVQSRYYNV